MERAREDTASRHSMQTVLRRRTGSFVAVEISVSFAPDLGAHGRIVIVFRDIRERLETEERLQALSAAVQTMGDGVVLLDAAGGVLYANPAFERFVDHDLAELVGMGPSGIGLLLGAGRTGGGLADAVSMGLPRWTGILHCDPSVSKDAAQTTCASERTGAMRWIETELSAVHDSVGGIQGFVALLRDVTQEVAMDERRERARTAAMARAVAAREMQLALPLEQRLAAVGDVLWKMDWLDLTTSGCARLASGETVSLSRDVETPDPAVLDGWLALAEASPRDETRLLTCRDDGRTAYVVPLRHLEVEQGVLILEAAPSVEPHDETSELLDHIGHVVGTAVAIDAARDQADRERRRAEEANQSKTDFLANMSHEIRTPMTAILGFAEMLEDDSVTMDAELRRSLIETIRRSGDHLLRVIDDILDISRIEAGRLTIEYVPADLGTIVEDVVSLVRPSADRKGLALRSSLEPSRPDVLRSDPVRIRQVIVNLLGNAVKFTERGAIELRTEVTRLDVDRVLVTIEVTDTGIGMRADEAARVFDAFEQADGSVVRRFGGTGLGLAISRSIARMLGGDLTVVSEPGRGSTFTFTFESSVVSEVSEASEAVAGAGPHAMDPNGAATGATIGVHDAPGTRASDGAGLGRTVTPATDVGSATGTTGDGTDGATLHGGAAADDGGAPGDPAGPLAGHRVLVVDDGADNRRLVEFFLRRSGRRSRSQPTDTRRSRPGRRRSPTELRSTSSSWTCRCPDSTAMPRRSGSGSSDAPCRSSP